MILLTDRNDMSQMLFTSMSDIEPCTRLRLDGVVEMGGPHRIVVCDVDLDRPENLAAAKAVLGRCNVASSAPILCLLQNENASVSARGIGATAVISRRATQAQIIFTIRRLIEGSEVGKRKRPLDPTSIVAVRIEEAGSHFTDILDASRNGQVLSQKALQRGGDAIVAAVGGGRIAPWLDAVHAYDDLTYQHCLLVAGLATAFAKHLGISLAGQQVIAQAGLIHDIGKVRIPAHIINKPGRLTVEEMNVVRRHPVIGHDMLVEQGGFDPRKLDIVLHHHEFMDGSGYPDRLAGDRIAPMVRLVTIADIYAALIERRSYKPPMPLTDALEIIRGMKGKLDPSLVTVFDAFVRRK